MIKPSRVLNVIVLNQDSIAEITPSSDCGSEERTLTCSTLSVVSRLSRELQRLQHPSPVVYSHLNVEYISFVRVVSQGKLVFNRLYFNSFLYPRCLLMFII